MRNTAALLISFFTLFIGMAAYGVESARAEDASVAPGVENAWREGFAAGLAASQNIAIEDSLDFSLPVAEYKGVMFSGAFNFNGSIWELDPNGLSILDNVVLATMENDGETIKLDSGDILRVMLDVDCCGSGSWMLTEDYNKDALLLYKKVDMRWQGYIPWEAGIGIVLGGTMQEEWVFLCQKQGVSHLEFTNHAYYTTPCHDPVPKTFTIDIEVR
ncbi:MAG: hypothetical protein GY859_20995 [Desulfobacterales bacterium]|nr:hypothetical protein [Desulfobacterales bacterium]